MCMKKKINKYIIQIGLCFLLLSGLFSILVQKYAPFLLHKTIYYCQEIIKSINTNDFSQNSNTIFLVPVLFIIVLVAARLSITITQVFVIARKLNRQKITYHSLQLDKLIRKNRLTNKVKVIKDNQPFALCYGLFRPKIYLSTRLLNIMSPYELEVILKHEKHHLSHYDNLTIFFAHVIQSAFPIMPILYDLVKNFRIEREIAADTYASARGNRQHLAAVLKKLLRQPQPVFTYFPSLSGEDSLQARIESLFFKKQFISNYSLKNIALSFFSILILSGLIIIPVSAIEFHTNGQDAILACVNNQQCVTQCKQNLYYIQNMSPVPNK